MHAPKFVVPADFRDAFGISEASAVRHAHRLGAIKVGALLLVPVERVLAAHGEQATQVVIDVAEARLARPDRRRHFRPSGRGALVPPAPHAADPAASRGDDPEDERP